MNFFDKLKEHKATHSVPNGTILRARIELDNVDEIQGDINDKGRYWKLVFVGIGDHEGVRLTKHLYSEHSSEFTVNNSMNDIKSILSSHYQTSITDLNQVVTSIQDLVGLTCCVSKSSFLSSTNEAAVDCIGKILIKGDAGYIPPSS